MEGWTDIMYIYQDVDNEVFVNGYFMLCIVLCSFFLLNLTIAVMLKEYELLDKMGQNSVHKTQLKDIGLGEAKLPRALFDFIMTQNNLTIRSSKAKEILGANKTFCERIFATE